VTKHFVKILLVSLIVLAASNAGFVLADSVQGVVDINYKYAWGEKLGWVNFATDGAGPVTVTSSGLSGYAWTKIYGWINLNPAGSGVKNDGAGNLSGYAWGENAGWINFSGVKINSEGRFMGTATGDISGTINFDCDNCNVFSSWIPLSSEQGGTSGGGGSSLPGNGPNAEALGVVINNGNAKTNNRDVVLNLAAGSDVKFVAVSNVSDFTNIPQEDYQLEKAWTVDSGDGVKTVYVKFYNKYGTSSDVISASIILDTVLPNLTITKSQAAYKSTENVVIGGTSGEQAKIDLFIDNNSYTEFTTDIQGNWLITLGKYSVGNHHLEFTPKDLAGNTGNIVSFDFTVTGEAATEPETETPPQNIITGTLSPLLQKIQEQLNALLPNIVKPEEIQPTEVVVISKETPVALLTGWDLLSKKEIGQFVFSPLPTEIALIAQKFPEVKKTFTEVGVTSIRDVSKLQSTTLKLPSLTETVGISGVELEAGEITQTKGIPIAQLTSTAKSKIPSEIVFTKTGGGLIDFNTALSINNKGATEQRITTLVGNLVQFVVKVDSPAKSVKGYLLFKSKKPESVSYNVSLGDMTASLLFSNPDFAVAAPENFVENAESDQKLVIKEFEYTHTGDGVYTAEVSMPVVSGEYEAYTIVDYQDQSLGKKEINIITVVDPEGYVFEKNGDKETRISGSIISLYWLNPETKQYELWAAKNYQQENPQVTDVTGNYSFLVPEGYYYLKVDAPGYLSYDGKPFEVTEGSGVHINIELKTKYWWIAAMDWKTALLAIALLLLIYNFYRDKIRDSMLIKKNN